MYADVNLDFLSPPLIAMKTPIEKIEHFLLIFLQGNHLATGSLIEYGIACLCRWQLVDGTSNWQCAEVHFLILVSTVKQLDQLCHHGQIICVQSAGQLHEQWQILVSQGCEHLI
jgi:hypothetical protein